MRSKINCFLILFLSLIVSGCQSKPTGLAFDVPELPHIEDFSGATYENYKSHYSPVKSAVFIHDGVEETIAPDDPRLIRLLNFIVYSKNEALDGWSSGYVPEEEINEFLATDAPMLDVYFYHTEGTSLAETPRMLICGDSYLNFIDPVLYNKGMEGTFADRSWPYAALVPVSLTEEISFNGWGNDYWIDLLAYAGFETG